MNETARYSRALMESVSMHLMENKRDSFMHATTT